MVRMRNRVKFRDDWPSQVVAEIWGFICFQNGAVRHLCFIKLELTVHIFKMPNLPHRA